MNKVEQLILESVQQSLSALERIDIVALQGRCAAFADGHCRLDNLGLLLEHCRRYQEASHKGDTGQVMNSRRDINVYSRTMGFSPEGVDSLLKVLAGQGAPPPPPPPPRPPLPPIDGGNSGGGGQQKSKPSPFVLGLVAIVVCFVLGLVWILNRDPEKPTPAPPAPVVDTNHKIGEYFSYGEEKDLETNAKLMCLVTLKRTTNGDSIFFYKGQISKGEPIRAYRIKREYYSQEVENKAESSSRIGFLVQTLANIAGLKMEDTYFYGFEKSEVISSNKYTQKNIIENHPLSPVPSEHNPHKDMPLSLWEAIQRAKKP